ncbi:MAG: sugar phosphate isomerase/epimerase [Acidobacteriia bacterium]|nr:sugar phosphate isomerase/epimerase [Terriglobia bacterium]
MPKPGRRSFLKTGFLSLAGVASFSQPGTGKAEEQKESETPPPFKLGLVTYELAKDWDIETIIKNCEATAFAAVELRTTHKHGVELALGKAQRAVVRKKFAGSRVRLLSLGSTCEYHYADPALVEKNIEETRRWCELAKDLGALGVKVRPNGFVKGVPQEKTLEQIGQALEKCGEAARNAGVEIWLEVHGEGTQHPPHIRRIMEISNHPAVGICWNSNDADVVNGSVKEYFELLRPWLRNCHINELWRSPSPWGSAAGQPPDKVNPGFPDYAQPYPFRELFSLLRAAGYNRYTLAEVPQSCEPIRFMRYYRALWEQLAK